LFSENVLAGSPLVSKTGWINIGKIWAFEVMLALPLASV